MEHMPTMWWVKDSKWFKNKPLKDGVLHITLRSEEAKSSNKARGEVAHVKVGDILFSYKGFSDRREVVGVAVCRQAPEERINDEDRIEYAGEVDYYPLSKPLRVQDIPEEVRASATNVFNVKQQPKSGFIWRIESQAFKSFLTPYIPRAISQRFSTMSTTSIKATNVIFYGPPGTGKTYGIRHYIHDFLGNQAAEDAGETYARLLEEGRVTFVTFHQSYNYEDFIEGLRPKTNDAGQLHYEVQDGVFKDLAKRAYDAWRYEVSGVDFDALWSKALTTTPPPSVHWTLQLGSYGKFTLSMNESPQNNSILSKEALRGPWEVLREHPEKLTEFFGEPWFKIDGMKDGLKEFFKWLRTLEKGEQTEKKERQDKSTAPHYFMIIDEINRGNISKIFGELITLLEPTKRSGESEALSVQLPLSRAQFELPPNLHLIATMNTADRSIALMDTALRRRFTFRECMPDPSKLDGLNGEMRVILKTLNDRVEFLYDREHTIGHAFFMQVKSHEDLRDVFCDKIIPLLTEYFHEDWEKVALVLNAHVDDKEAPLMLKAEVLEKSIFYKANANTIYQPEVKKYSINKDFISATGANLKPYFEHLLKAGDGK